LHFRILNAFKTSGVIGKDLLIAENWDPLNDRYQIIDPLHQRRFRKALSDIVARQKEALEVEKKDEKLRETERGYYELLEQFEKMKMGTGAPYQLPKKIEQWKPIEVFYFLKTSEHKDSFATFVKPFALRNISGRDFANPASLVSSKHIFFTSILQFK
jgi:hypothetical protein